MSNKKVIIIGAGLAGSLLSLYLAKRGIETEVYESRGDMRLEEISAGRSINLALSDRGIAALKQVGMDEYMLDEAVPMYGRLIHSVDGSTKLLPYSGREGEYINSVSRGGLNIALINEADNYAESTFYFDQKCVDFDCESGEAIIENTETGEKKRVKGDTLIATDGAGSAVRKAMFSSKCVPRFNFQQDFLEHGYKELSILPKSEFVGELPKLSDQATGEFLMANDALHIWARHQFMMIALPNFDGSFTCTLFHAFKGEHGFESLKDEKSLMNFFEKYYSDAIPLMPNLKDEFFANPTGNLGTIRCFPWNVGGKSLLLGDSAHAIVPFYGQGMNASFEDCRIFDELLEKHGTDWEKIFTDYSNQRKINTDAIADLALENFHEMQDAVADPIFVKKRELETRLEHTFPDYFSKYSLVTFREEIPYSEAKKRGNAQNDLLMQICENVKDVSEIDLNEVMKKIKSISLLILFLLSGFIISVQAQASLKETFKNDFMIGVALNRSQFYSEDKIALPIVKKHFNTISPENVLKWENVHPKLDKYNFKDADKFVEFGEKNGMFIIGHALVWHSQIPQEVFEDKKGNLVSRKVLLKRMRDHIRTVVGRYRGRIDAWDVVNEAVGDNGKMRDSLWRKIIGEDYIEKAFEYAHEADPNAELYYNDYSIEGEVKRQLTLKLVKKLLNKKIPIKGIGTQGHFNMTFPTVKEQDETIKAFAALGLKVMITEFDIDVLPRPKGSGGAEISMTFEMQKEFDPYKNGLPDEIQKKLAERYSELFGVFLANREHITRVTFWNVTDKESWLNSYPVRGRTNYPLLFDRKGNTKLAFDYVIKAGSK